MVVAYILVMLLWATTNATNIHLQECEPPDYPHGGGYGPRQEFYIPGDFIRYYCNVDTFIGGNFYRRCEDTGDWSGDTPVCDVPSAFSSTRQSSTADDHDLSESGLATDGIRTTCTATKGGQKDEWFGTFTAPGQLIRVMLFLPRGRVSFQVVLVKADGSEVVCGTQTTNIDRYEWTFQNCPEPNNTGASGLKIKSLTTAPLKICEIQAYVLTAPTCPDPHLRIESGRVRLTRKTAVLVCTAGYAPSDEKRLDCVRDGVWNRKPLYCMDREWEVDNSGSLPGENGGPKDNEPNVERLRISKMKRTRPSIDVH